MIRSDVRDRLSILCLLVLLVASFRATAQTDPLPSWNDGAAKQAIVEFVRTTTTQGEPEVRPARGAHRHVRPGRHAVGRASDVLAGDVLPRPRARAGQGEARTGEGRAVQDRVDRQPRGDREAADGGPREAPRRHAERHVGRHVQGRGDEVDRRGEGSALEAAVHRAHLSADAGSAQVPARERLQDVYRDRRRAGLRARVRGGDVWHSARAGRGHRGRNEIRVRQGRQAVPDEGARSSC